MVIEPQDDRRFEIDGCIARFDQIGGLHFDLTEGREELSISPEKFEQIAREGGFVPANEK